MEITKSKREYLLIMSHGKEVCFQPLKLYLLKNYQCFLITNKFFKIKTNGITPTAITKCWVQQEFLGDEYVLIEASRKQFKWLFCQAFCLVKNKMFMNILKCPSSFFKINFIGMPFLPGESHGQRNLAVYSPCGGKESDMTEQLILPLFPILPEC